MATQRIRNFARRAAGAVGRLRRDRRGGVAVLFAASLLPMLGAVGLALDFGAVMAARTKAQMAADAAALYAAGVARDLLKSSDGSAAATSAAIAEARTRGAALFKAHADQSNISGATVAMTVTRDGQAISASAAFKVVSTNHVGRIFGASSFNASGGAESRSSLPNYSDVYLALDISGSMGIAASQAEMVKLFNARGAKKDGTTAATGCVFGCHVVEDPWKESFSAIASRLGIQLRIDVLREAVQKMITTAEADAASAPIYRIGLYTMGASADASTWSLNQLAPLSNNFASLRSAAASIDIATPPASAPQKQNSYINEQLAGSVSQLPTSYDGTSQALSKKYVFIITDGARDVPPSFGSCITPQGSGRCVNGIDASVCQSFKNKGITVAVLYTTYVPVTENPANPSGPLEYWFNLEMVQTGAYAKIQPALQACASPGWFFQASDGAAIDVAMQKMFAQTTFAPSLTD